MMRFTFDNSTTLMNHRIACPVCTRDFEPPSELLCNTLECPACNGHFVFPSPDTHAHDMTLIAAMRNTKSPDVQKHALDELSSKMLPTKMVVDLLVDLCMDHFEGSNPASRQLAEKGKVILEGLDLTHIIPTNSRLRLVRALQFGFRRAATLDFALRVLAAIHEPQGRQLAESFIEHDSLRATVHQLMKEYPTWGEPNDALPEVINAELLLASEAASVQHTAGQQEEAQKTLQGIVDKHRIPNWKAQAIVDAAIDATSSVREAMSSCSRDAAGGTLLNIPRGYTQLQREAFMTALNFPSDIDRWAICDLGAHNMFALENLHHKGWRQLNMQARWISPDLIKKICEACQLPHIEVQFQYNGGTYDGKRFRPIVDGAQYWYREALARIDQVCIFPEFPFVIMHRQEQSSAYWESYYFCVRTGITEFHCKELLVKLSETARDERQRAFAALERSLLLARLGPEKLAILEEARNMASIEMQKHATDANSPLGFVTIISDLHRDSIGSLYRGPSELPILLSGAIAYGRVLKEAGIDFTISELID
jgi:hypothetical protein